MVNDEIPIIFPACVVTRTAAQRDGDSQETVEPSGSVGSKDNQDDEATTNDSISRKGSVNTLEATSSLSRTQLMADQKNDSKLMPVS